MPRYRVNEKTYIDGRLYKEGDVVDYDGQPAKSLELMDKDAKKKDEFVRKVTAPALPVNERLDNLEITVGVENIKKAVEKHKADEAKRLADLAAEAERKEAAEAKARVDAKKAEDKADAKAEAAEHRATHR